MKFYNSTLAQSKTAIYFSLLFFVSFNLIIFISCSQPAVKTKQIIVVGISSDVATINPLYAFSPPEGHLMDLLFLKPMEETWNDSLGVIEFSPLLAESWTINKDSNYITLNIRDNLHWSDGKPITVDDIIFTFDIYSDPKVNSRLYGMFDNFYSTKDLHIDIKKTFRKNSDKSLTIFFKNYQNFSFLDINLSILPEHAYRELKRENIETAEINFYPVTSGPFKLVKWERVQRIHIKADSACYLFNPNKLQEIIFKIIPDEFSLLTQIKKGEIDLAEDIKSEKVKELTENGNISIGSIRGRDYSYIGWNYVDPAAKQKEQNKPNKFFSSLKTRKALSLAVNRIEIFQSVIGKYGEIYDSPISPIFKLYYDSTLSTVDYNPALAKKLLAEDGWKDINGNGILEKNNQEFSFKIYSNTGNSKREFAATIIKNNLREVGIDAEIIFIERNELVDGLLSRKYDAWLSGWSVEIPLNLDPFWSSDPEKGTLNFASFTDQELDKLLNDIKPSDSEEKKKLIYDSISNIFKQNEPVTILFWSDNIIAYNKRIKNINFSPLGLYSNAWKWETEK